MQGEARVHVAAPPEKVWGLVTDVTRMGEWSPECVKCEWIDGANGPAVGARFKGTNKKGIARWSTKPTVVVVDPGKEFAFDTGNTLWRYRFEAAGDGTDVIESFEETKAPGLLLRIGERIVTGPDREGQLVKGMEQTLERIKAAAERS